MFNVKEYQKEYQKKYRKKNKETLKLYARAYYKKLPTHCFSCDNGGQKKKQWQHDIVSELRIKRLGYAQIGRLLGISRARVHQIASGYRSTLTKSKIDRYNKIKSRDNYR